MNEEEFGFSNALAWSADSKTLSWIRYDESKVRTYTLQLFKGAYPTLNQYNTYPGEYSYKYPKAGEENSTVTAWSYNLSNGAVRKYDCLWLLMDISHASKQLMMRIVLFFIL